MQPSVAFAADYLVAIVFAGQHSHEDARPILIHGQFRRSAAILKLLARTDQPLPIWRNALRIFNLGLACQRLDKDLHGWWFYVVLIWQSRLHLRVLPVENRVPLRRGFLQMHVVDCSLIWRQWAVDGWLLVRRSC